MQGKNSGKQLYILTVDLEDWFHLLDIPSTSDYQKWDYYEERIYNNTYIILDILYKKKIKATFFILGWIAKKYPDLIKYISDQGHEIGTHSQNHILIYNSNPLLFRKDILESIEIIQSIIDKKIIAFRAPGFSITKESLWALKILAEIGITVDSSIFPAIRGHGGIKNFHLDQPFLFKIGKTTIKEFPINVYKNYRIRLPFSGGGYFRLIPFFMLKYFIKKSDYVMTYIHPRDFDENQPIIRDISLIRKFKSYYGLGNSLEKFKKIINEFNFINIDAAISMINWENVPIINYNI